jgi:hypothetical protein
VQAKVRRALGSWAADANVVDEVIQDVRVYIFEGSIALAAYEERPELLEEFLEQCVGICVRRYLARRTRRKHHEVQAGDDQLAQLVAEAQGLDEVTIQEFRQRLTPAEDQFFVRVLLGNREQPAGHPAATDNERQLVRSILEKWKKFRAEQ